MKGWTKEILRWVGVIVPGGYGIWGFMSSGAHVVRINESWGIKPFALIFLAAIYSPFLAFAYICLRRHYRDLLIVFGALLAIGVCFLLDDLPHRLNVIDYSVGLIQKDPSWIIVFFPLSIVMLVGAILGCVLGIPIFLSLGSASRAATAYGEFTGSVIASLD